MAGRDDSPDLQGAALVSQDDPWIGQALGSYTIIQRIGVGGMGVVYLARHESLDRLVAIKFLPAQMVEDKGYVEMFLREAKAAAKLSHPNIVTVHDAGHIGNEVYYFIMEYVEGRDLSSVLRERGCVPLREAIGYMRQAATALGYAHRKGVVHRDIKPENLMVTSEGNIKIGDLGLAKWVGEDAGSMTQSGALMGSPMYIAPERLKDPTVNDPRCDIYSLGGTFHHLITGKVPYSGSSPMIMAMHLTAPVPDPRDSNPLLDSEISLIIKRMMAKEPADRYQSMEEVDAALAEYQLRTSDLAQSAVKLEKPKRIEPEPESFPEASDQAAPARGKSAILAAAGLGLLAVGVLGYFWMSRPPVKPPATALPPPIASAPVKSAPAQVPPPAPVTAGAAEELLLANFDQASDPRRLDVLVSPAPAEARCFAGVQGAKGVEKTAAWGIAYDITAKDSSARAILKLDSIDATDFKTLEFKTRAEGAASALTYAIDVKVGPAQRRYKVRNVGKSWTTVKIPLDSLALPSLKPLNQLDVVVEWGTTAEKKGTILIDDVRLTKE
jgi:serine/threonine protein kinase